MIIGRIEGANKDLARPKDWDPVLHGHCASLPVRVAPAQGSGVVMISAWFPSPEEIALMVAGRPVYLHVYGGLHPPVFLAVEP